METPMPSSKVPRRKLRKVLKKKPSVNLNSSTYNKLKSAINSSLNSSHKVRSLLSNNKLLAAKHESVQIELRLMTEAYTALQKKNHELSERNLFLERTQNEGDSMQFVEEQVNKKFRALVQELKKHLRAMTMGVQETMENLLVVTNLCSLRNSSGISSAETSRSSSSIFQKTPNSDMEPERAITTRSKGKCDKEDQRLGAGRDLTQFVSASPEGAPSSFDEMSMIVEQSMLTSPVHGSITRSNLSSVSENVNTGEIKKPSKMPKRILKKPSSGGSTESLPSTSKSACADDNIGFEDTTEVHRQTFVISNDEPQIIDDMQEPILVPLDDDIDTCQLITDMPNESPPLQKSGCQWSEKSRSLVELSQQKPKTMMKNAPRPGRPKLKEKKKDDVLTTKSKKSLCISNEFELLNNHKAMMERIEKKAPEPENDPESDKKSPDVNCALEDMEFTSVIDWAPEKGPSNAAYNSLETLTASRKEANGTNSVKARSREKTIDESSNVGDQEEKVPDGVRMRMAKPGKFVFAASRKEEDGSRKSLPAVQPKARSKSKKQIAEMIEKLPQEEPKSIFDFHDKTPTLSQEKTKPKSVYSFSVEESILSPPLPLGKNRQNQSDKDLYPFNEGDQLGKSNTSAVLLHNTSFQEELKSSPVKGSNKAKNVSQRISRSRSKSRQASSTVSQENEKEILAKRGKEIPGIQKNERRASDQNDTCKLIHELSFREVLKDSPQKKSNKNVGMRASRSRSRNRMASSCADVEENEKEKSPKKGKGAQKGEMEMNDSCKLIHESSFREALKDSPQKCNNSKQRASRSRSKSMKERLSLKNTDTNEEVARTKKDEQTSNGGLMGADAAKGDSVGTGAKACFPKQIISGHVSTTENAAVSTQPVSLLGKGSVYEEPLKGSPGNKRNERMHRSRSRSKSRAKVTDKGDGGSECSSNLGYLDSKRSCQSKKTISQDELTESTAHNAESDHTVDTGITSTFASRNITSDTDTVNEDPSGRSSKSRKFNLLSDNSVFEEPLNEGSPQERKQRSKSLHRSRGRSRHASSSNDIQSVRSKSSGSKVYESISPPPIAREHRSKKVKTAFIDSDKEDDQNPSAASDFVEDFSEKSNQSEKRLKATTFHPDVGEASVFDCVDLSAVESPNRNASPSETANIYISNEEQDVEIVSPKSKKKNRAKMNIQTSKTPQRTMNNQPSTTKKVKLTEKASPVKVKSAKRGKKSLGKKIVNAETKSPGKDKPIEQLFGRIKNLKTPDLLKGDKESTRTSAETNDTPVVYRQKSAGSPRSVKRPPIEATGESSPPKKRRAAAAAVNYAEPSLVGKLRRGDPFTSYLYKGQKVEIFKSPRAKARKKSELRRDILGPLHNLVEKE